MCVCASSWWDKAKMLLLMMINVCKYLQVKPKLSIVKISTSAPYMLLTLGDIILEVWSNFIHQTKEFFPFNNFPKGN